VPGQDQRHTTVESKLVKSVLLISANSRVVFGKGKRMHADLIAPSSELSQYVRGQHFGVAAGHINVQVGQGLQIVECIVEGDLLAVRIVGIRDFIGHLNLIYKEIILVCAVFHDLTDMSRKLQRIAIANITGQVQLKGQNVIFGNALAEKVALKQIAKQIGLAASADAGNDLYLAIPHKGDNFSSNSDLVLFPQSNLH